MDSGGTQFVYSGANVTNTMIGNGDTEIVYSGGSTSFTTVSSGGTLIILPGGSQDLHDLGHRRHHRLRWRGRGLSAWHRHRFLSVRRQ